MEVQAGERQRPRNRDRKTQAEGHRERQRDKKQEKETRRGGGTERSWQQAAGDPRPRLGPAAAGKRPRTGGPPPQGCMLSRSRRPRVMGLLRTEASLPPPGSMAPGGPSPQTLPPHFSAQSSFHGPSFHKACSQQISHLRPGSPHGNLVTPAETSLPLWAVLGSGMRTRACLWGHPMAATPRRLYPLLQETPVPSGLHPGPPSHSLGLLRGAS